MSWFGTLRNSWPLRKIGLGTEEKSNEVPILITPTNKFTAFLEPYETYVLKFQTLFIWEKPVHSAIAIVAANALFWFTVYFKSLCSFIYSTAIALFVLRHIWQHYVWPEISVPVPPSERNQFSEEWLEINPRVYSVYEIGDCLQSLWEKTILWKDQVLREWPDNRLLYWSNVTIVCSLLFLGYCSFWNVSVAFYLMNILVLTPGVYIYAIKPFSTRICHTFEICYSMISSKVCYVLGINENGNDDLNEFMPELVSEEAAAALSVPLLAADPPAVVAAVEAKGMQKKTKKSSKKVPKPGASLETDPHSQLNSLTPLLPPEDLPSVSDSSDDEDEFMQGLLFDKSQSQPNSLDVSRLNESRLTSDAVDAGNKVSLLANLLTQYPGVGQEILSNIGQNIMSHLMTQAGEHDPTTPQITEVFSDEDTYETTENLETRARRRMNVKNIPQSSSTSHDDFEMVSDEDMTDEDE